jgi:NADH:ubiquinone oxidoreductase subunit 3 (subunit A)
MEAMFSRWDILITPLLGFVLFAGVGWLIFKLGDKLAPRLTDVGGKLAQYACGEDFPAGKVQVGYRFFFLAALFFTIMHVAAMVISTLPAGSMAFALLGIFYLVMICLSIAALILK